MARGARPLRATQQCRRIGEELRLARLEAGLTRQHVVRLSGLSWSTIARVELGDSGATIATLCRIGQAVGLDVVLRGYPGPRPTLRDRGQLALADQLVNVAHATWQPVVELAVGEHGEAIDLAFFGPIEIVAVEIERLIADFQAQYRRADAKRQRLSSLHRRPVRLVLAVEDRRPNRAALVEHRGVTNVALPAGSRAVMEAFRSGKPLGRDGLLWVRRRPFASR